MGASALQADQKNQCTTDITAGSCYREVRWNSTNGQNPTFSHLYARSQLRKWQWPSSSRCVAGHVHFSKAGSRYREVRWNRKVSTNGQNPTFSHLYARSQLRNWQWPLSSRFVAGHRQGHPEKDPHFSKELAQGCWKLDNYLSPSLGLGTRESSLCD